MYVKSMFQMGIQGYLYETEPDLENVIQTLMSILGWGKDEFKGILQK